MTDDPRALRTYAAIFENTERVCVSGKFLIPTEACIAAANALRFQADYLDRLKEY